MTYSVTENMIGLPVYNAMDGETVGTAGRLIFGRKKFDFQYLSVERPEKAPVYLQYADILRVDSRSVIVFYDEHTGGDYDLHGDADAFSFVGFEAVDSGGRSVGRISSAELDARTGVIEAFSLRQGGKEVTLEIADVVGITDGGLAILREADAPERDPEKEALPEPVYTLPPVSGPDRTERPPSVRIVHGPISRGGRKSSGVCGTPILRFAALLIYMAPESGFSGDGLKKRLRRGLQKVIRVLRS